MSIIRFKNWDTPGSNPLTHSQRLSTSEVGAKSITSGLTRFQPGRHVIDERAAPSGSARSSGASR